MKKTMVAGASILALLGFAPGAMASYSADISGGTLRVTGDGAGDRLVLLPDGTAVALDVGADGTVDFRFEKSAFGAVEIAAGGGDDEVTLFAAAVNDKTVTIDGGSGNDTLLGGAGPETLIGGSGDDIVDGNLGADTVLLGSGNDRFRWDPGDGSDTVEGQGNTDTLEFNGSNAGEIFGVAANAGRVRFTRNIANIVMDLDGIEAINTRMLGSADTATVTDLAGTDVKTVDFDLGGADGVTDAVVAAGPGDFTFAGGALVKGVTARLTISGNDGADALRVDGTGPSDRVTFAGTDGPDAFDFVANGAFARLGNAETINVESVLATGGSGDDSFSAVGNLAALTQFTFDGGSGADTLRGGNGADVLLGGGGDDLVDGNQGVDTATLGSGNDRFNWDPGDGNDTVEGGSGTDALDFQGSNIGELFTLSANGDHARFTRNIANIVMDLGSVETVNTFSRGGADVATVTDLTGSGVRTVNADFGGADGVTDALVASGEGEFTITDGALVSGIGARLTVAGLDGADALRVDGQGADDGLTYTGTPGPDAFNFVANGTFLRRDNAESAGVERVRAIGGSGEDTFTAVGNVAALGALIFDGGNDNDTLRGGNGADTLLAGSGDDVVDGNQGVDSAQLGSGDDHFVWDPGDGNDTVEGQSGTDALDFNGANIGELFTLSADGDRARFTRNIANIVMDLGGVETVDVIARGGADNLTVGDMTGTAVRTAGIDLGGADGVIDSVTQTATDKRDTIRVTAENGEVLSTGLRAQLRIRGAEPADALRIDTLDGDDRVTVDPLVFQLLTPSVF
jgi:Ca2+-binding RTX toxin-like protein